MLSSSTAEDSGRAARLRRSWQEFAEWLPRVVRTWKFWLATLLNASAFSSLRWFQLDGRAGWSAAEEFAMATRMYLTTLVAFAIPTMLVIFWDLRIGRSPR
jgi:hypothetical protein